MRKSSGALLRAAAAALQHSRSTAAAGPTHYPFPLLQQHADPKQLQQQQHRLQHTAAEPQQQHAHHRPLEQSLADTLAAAAGGKAGSSQAVLAQHGVDEGYTPPMPPDLVLFPQNTQQVRVWWLGVAPLSRSLCS